MSSLKNEKFFKILVIIFAFFFIGVGLVAAKNINISTYNDRATFLGKVGINGTSESAAWLTVQGNAYIANAVQLGALGNSGVVLLKADNDGNLSTQSTTTLPVAAGNVIAGNFGANVGGGDYNFLSGKVRVGTTTNFAEKFLVDGSAYITNRASIGGVTVHYCGGLHCSITDITRTPPGHLTFSGSTAYDFDNDITTAGGLSVADLSPAAPVFADANHYLTSTGTYGAMYISSATPTSCPSANTYVSVAGTYLLLNNNSFSLGADNASLKYTGATTQKFLVTVSLSATSSVGSGRYVYFRLTKNGQSNTIYIQNFRQYSTYNQNVSLSGIFTLSTNDYVGVYTATSGTSKTVTVNYLNMQITPLGG